MPTSHKRKQKPVRVSAIISPEADLAEILQHERARQTGFELFNVEDKHEKRVAEEYQEFLLGKELGGEGRPEFYSIRYWKTKFQEDSWTKLYHLGHELGEDKRDMEISTTDPFTTMESLNRIGFKQMFAWKVGIKRFKYHNFDLKIMETDQGLHFLQANTTYLEKDEMDRKEKIDRMMDLFKLIGIKEANVFIGSALQYILYLKQVPVPIAGHKYTEEAPSDIPPEILEVLKTHPEWEKALKKGEILPGLEQELVKLKEGKKAKK